jgi:cytochrome P450
MTWTLRSYAAVSAALHDASLTADDTTPPRPAEVLRLAQDAIRAAARQQFPATKLAEWRDALRSSAHGFAETLEADTPVDLMTAFAAPWALQFAARVAGLASADVSRLAALAHEIFVDAATATHLADRRAGESAALLATALARHAPSASLDVQSFVAISQTLPHLLASVWHALLSNTEQVAVWRTLVDKSNAIDELLRYAGPSRAVFRRARETTRCDATTIEAGQGVTIMLGDANFDPSVFSDPDRLDLGRANANAHVALGAGRHPCVGAPIIRVAVEAATSALIARVGTNARIEHVRWLDAFAIRAPSSLVIRIA